MNHVNQAEDLKDQVIYLQQRVAVLIEAARGAQKGNLRQHNKIVQLKLEAKLAKDDLDTAKKVIKTLKAQLDEVSASSESAYAVRRVQELTEENAALRQRNNELEEARLVTDTILAEKDAMRKRLAAENENQGKSYAWALNSLERENAMLRALATGRNKR